MSEYEILVIGADGQQIKEKTPDEERAVILENLKDKDFLTRRIQENKKLLEQIKKQRDEAPSCYSITVVDENAKEVTYHPSSFEEHGEDLYFSPE